MAFDGDAEDWNGCLCGDHPGEVGGSAGTGDDDLDATFPGRRCILSHEGRCPMRTNHFTFVWNIEFIQCLMRMTHRFPI